MPQQFSGGCACGSIRYESNVEPILMLHCHCRDCQRASGGPFTSIAVVPVEAFKLVQGTPRFFVTNSLSGGHLHRGFCPDCGSPVLGKPDPDAAFQFVGVTAASLDDPSWFKPVMHTFMSDAQPWAQINLHLPKFETYPPHS